jgi:threonine synthase
MKYVSTRGEAPVLGFDDVLLAGLATDGGLYVPEAWPSLSADDLRRFKGLSYDQIAFEVIRPFVGGTIPDDDLMRIIKTGYSRFSTATPAPLSDIGEGLWMMELFHGPTLAFKDVAMQFLGGLFDHVLRQRGERTTIIGATSGDTGSAGIEAVRGKDAVDIFMLHPEGRVSDVQRRQMTTVLDDNVYNIAVQGTFDDCQDLVKAMFNDPAFRSRHTLSAVNSINWGRIVAQIVYYVTAAVELGAPDNDVAFSVPTGNFGNVFAGYAAKQMGVPISQLLVASNSNDILTRFFETGAMETGDVYATISPSMDIQVSSNFERLLFELSNRDGGTVAAIMQSFRGTGRYEVAQEQLENALQLFNGARYNDDVTSAEIKRHFDTTGILIDPHSAVALAAAREHRRDSSIPMVVIGTAHPAKFSVAVKNATGVAPALPDHLSGLMEREERCAVLTNDLAALEAYIDDTTNGQRGAA